ncbi:hypothetical protein M5K25_003530 [Dendrobium thyrsiflorum]|uniref:Uncharacterized protein n=1 Tax=Dendrobium thyrsiflorum TaxID=117978 RepID=A0ABD0VS15_DENTH
MTTKKMDALEGKMEQLMSGMEEKYFGVEGRPSSIENHFENLEDMMKKMIEMQLKASLAIPMADPKAKEIQEDNDEVERSQTEAVGYNLRRRWLKGNKTDALARPGCMTAEMRRGLGARARGASAGLWARARAKQEAGSSGAVRPGDCASVPRRLKVRSGREKEGRRRNRRASGQMNNISQQLKKNQTNLADLRRQTTELLDTLERAPYYERLLRADTGHREPFGFVSVNSKSKTTLLTSSWSCWLQILIYCRSSILPQHQWPVNQKVFTFDVLYLHDKPGPENCPQKVYDVLVDALEHVSEHEGYIFESGQGLARVLFRHICILLAHPQQRCGQDDIDMPKSLEKKLLPPPTDPTIVEENISSTIQ